MKKRTKILILTVTNVFNALYGFLVFSILPITLLIAFNRTKGNVNNPEGEVFAIIGWFILILIPIIFVSINLFVIKMLSLSKWFLLLAFLCFIFGGVVKIIAVFIDGTYLYYYRNYYKELF